MNGLVVFYSICGVLIVGLLIRMWFKNRAAKVASQPAATATAKSTAATTPLAAAPVVVAAKATPEPIAAASSVPEPHVVLAAAEPVTESRYATSASATYTRLPEVSTWEDRRLFDQRGVITRSRVEPFPRVLPEDVPGADESDRTFGTTLNPALASLLPESNERRELARRELCSAGYYNPHALENLAATRYSLMMLSIIVFGGLLLVVPTRLEPWAIGGLVAGPMLGWALPMLYVRRKAAARVREISRAMPDMLDMLNMCVSQGLTVPDSLKRILRDFRGVYPALSQELNIVIEQTQINGMYTALENFGRRIDLPEVHSFTSLLIQTERMGTSISDALTTYSDTMRESLKQRADEKGNRATFRLLFPTVLCLMPAVYMFLLGPAVNELSKFFNAGGRDSLDSGTTAIQRINALRTGGTRQP